MLELNITENIIKLSLICLEKRGSKIEMTDLQVKDAEIILSISPGDKISSNELAARCSLSPSRMSRIVDRLFHKGYLNRIPHPEDRRFSELSLTKKGVKIRENIISYNKTCERELKNRMNEKEIEIVRKALKILDNALKRGYNE